MVGEKRNTFHVRVWGWEWPCLRWPRPGLCVHVFSDGFPALFPTFTGVEGFGADTALLLWKVLGSGGGGGGGVGCETTSGFAGGAVLVLSLEVEEYG